MTPGDVLEQILAIARDPTSNLTAAVLLVALLALVVLIVILVLLLAVTRRPAPSRARTRGRARSAEDYEYPELSKELEPTLPGEGEGADGPAKRRRLLSGRSGTILILVLVLLSAVSAVAVTSTDSYCLDACHTQDRGMDAKARGGHATSSCISCHEDALPLGLAGVVSLRTGHLVQLALPEIHSYAGSVPSYRCLSCHDDVLEKVINTPGGAKMSHRQPVDAGMACRDCHGDLGHGGGTRSVGMALCVRCHDSKQASAKCSSCHASDTGHASAAAGGSRGFPRVQLGPVTDCGGCHQQKTCDACHGLRMPHSAVFMAYGHARQGAFAAGKELCYRCHTYSDCSACHGDFGTHGATWRTEHMKAKPGDVCVCHWQKAPAEAKGSKGFCGLCH